MKVILLCEFTFFQEYFILKYAGETIAYLYSKDRVTLNNYFVFLFECPLNLYIHAYNIRQDITHKIYVFYLKSSHE